jgi:SAM-dependent methyltransferase
MTAAAALASRQLDRCLACGSTGLKRLPLRYEYRGSFPAAQCRTCGMRFLAVQPTADSLVELYSSAYFESDFRCGRSDSDYFAESAFRAENDGLLDAFATLGPAGTLLEVGCAGGWLLKHAAERGWEAQGVELSADAVAHARGLGLNVFHGELADAGLRADTFDLVYMGDVLEHVPDCRAVLADVARVLKPGGHLYLRGPITTNSLARRLGLALYGLLGRDIVLREPPYHLWEFTPPSLVRVMRSVGLEAVEVHESKIAPGRAHGSKSPGQRAAMYLLDALNAPLTRLVNRLGDRIVVVARKA